MNDYQIHVAGGIIIKDKKVLAVCSRGRLGFIAPGGKLEADETSEQALIREMKEELGVDIKQQNLKAYATIYEDAALGSHNVGKRVRMDAFIVSEWKGKPKALGEIDKIAWLDSQALKNVELGSILKKHLLPALKKAGLIT